MVFIFLRGAITTWWRLENDIKTRVIMINNGIPKMTSDTEEIIQSILNCLWKYNVS